MEDRLTVLAEVAVGLAGFSSVVIAFRRRASDGAWRPEDAFRFRLMLEAGLFAGFFALLPNAIAGLGVSEATLWPNLSAALLAYFVIDTIHSFLRSRRMPAGSLHRGFASITILFNCVSAGIQLLNVVDWLVPRGPGPYVFGVTWLTVYSGLTFYRLATAPIEVSYDEDSPLA